MMRARDFDYFILRCVALGFTSKRIATFIGYSEAAVSLQIMHMCRAQGVRGRRALVRHLCP